MQVINTGIGGATDAELAAHAAQADPHPASFVKLTASALQTIPTGALTRLTFWDTETVDDAPGFHEGVTNPSRITIPASYDGVYVIAAGIWWANAALGTITVLQMRLYKNGSVIAGGIFSGAPNAGFPTFGQGMRVVVEDRAVAGDYYEVFVFHDTTAAGTKDVGVSNAPSFSAARVGV